MSDAYVQQLLHAASVAPTQAEAERLVAEAEQAQNSNRRTAAQQREVDLMNAVVADHLTPARVHEHHTASTDWIAGLDTSGGENVAQEMVAQGSVWYAKTAGIRPWRDEFDEQARGQARKLAGAYGEQAAVAEESFLTHVASLYDRELGAGLIVQADSGLPQVGDPGNPEQGGTVGPMGNPGLPLEQTSSERAPVMQQMEHNASRTGAATGPGWHRLIGDEHDPDAPGPRHDPDGGWHHQSGDKVKVISVGTHGDEEGNVWAMAHHPNGGGDATFLNPQNLEPINERNASMQTANCPTCSGRGRVAVRAQAASGLPQVQQIVDSNNNPSSTPLPQEVAFPWEMAPDSQGVINEAEQQIADREKLKGASLQQRAQLMADQVYRRVLAGQDASGWLGDMGAGGVGPGQQDGGNPPPPSNLGQPDEVYGYGGDQPDRPMKPYGADEANDETNNPGMGWQPGQPTQYDQAGRGNTVGQPTASLIEQDPQLQQALNYARQRRAFLVAQAQR